MRRHSDCYGLTPSIASRAITVGNERAWKTLFSTQIKNTLLGVFYLAEKEGFEPSLRYSHTTPLAGEPLEPLGYFSVHSTQDY